MFKGIIHEKAVDFTVNLRVDYGALSGCGSSESDSASSNKLVIYSPNSEEIIKTIIPMFEKQTGITVELVTAGTGEIIKRLQSEKQNPYADVMFGGSMAGFRENEALYEPYVSPEDKNLMEGHRNTSGFATPYISDGAAAREQKSDRRHQNRRLCGFVEPAPKGRLLPLIRQAQAPLSPS